MLDFLFSLISIPFLLLRIAIEVIGVLVSAGLALFTCGGVFIAIILFFGFLLLI